MALTIAQDYISQALRKCGQMRAGYVPQPELLADILNEWGSLFDGWATERDMGFSVPQYTYAVAGAGSQGAGSGYLIGPLYSFTGTTVIGSPIITGVVDTSLVSIGEAISGTGIPASSTVVSVTATTITISQNATAAGAVTITATPDWTGPRPPAIVRANCKVVGAGQSPYYLHLTPMSTEEWADQSIRLLTPGISITNAFYYDPQFPNGVFNVFPNLTSGNSIELFTNQALAVPASLTTPYSAPPAYRDAVIWSLAERAWPLCTKQVGIHPVSIQWLAGAAYEACQKVRTMNRPIPRLKSDFPSGGGGGGFYDSNVARTGEPT